LATPDFALLARACGIPYARIAAEDEAGPVLAEATSADGPVLVEVDLTALGPMKTPFTPPVKIPDAARTPVPGPAPEPSTSTS
ncbi:thiamine pyrophosphate-binding protein, partial [Streptomyces daliensis]|nr:thiamine pyrophosphate-binding protein [Streptomyces daliensis]